MPTPIYHEPTEEATNDRPVRQTRAVAAAAAAATAAPKMNEDDIETVDGDRSVNAEALPPPPATRSSPRRNAGKLETEKGKDENQNSGDGDQQGASNQAEEEQDVERPNAGRKRKTNEGENQPSLHHRSEERRTRTEVTEQSNKRKKTTTTSSPSSSSMPPTHARSLIGTRISKKFVSEIFGKEEFYDGIVVSGPVKLLNKETKKMEESWKIQYTDGDKEDMTLEEIRKWSVEDLEDTEASSSSPSSATATATATATSPSAATMNDPPQKKVAAPSKSSAADGSGGDGKKKSPTKRKCGNGPEDNRTCPNCKRVYGSLTAFKYHVSKFSMSVVFSCYVF